MTDLKKLAELAEELIQAREEVVRLEAELAAAKRREQDLSDVQIPELMDELGMTEFTTSSGFKLKVTDKIRANLASPAIHEWLRATGNAGLIRSEVKVPFKRDQDELARQLCMELAERELAADLRQTVPWNSFQSVVRKMLQDGEDVPIEDLGIHVQRVTEVKQ